MTYRERGHSLTTRRGKSTKRQRELREMEAAHKYDSNLTEIDKWQKEHRHIMGSLQEFSEWWKGVWADFNDDTEEILEYLQTLCRQCLSETVNQKGRRMCMECITMNV